MGRKPGLVLNAAQGVRVCDETVSGRRKSRAEIVYILPCKLHGTALGKHQARDGGRRKPHPFRGAQVQAALGAYLPEEQAWVFLMKDGDARIVIVVPDGQITEVGEVTFASNSAVGWQVTLSCYPDANGNSIYIMTDDGVTTA